MPLGVAQSNPQEAFLLTVSPRNESMDLFEQIAAEAAVIVEKVKLAITGDMPFADRLATVFDSLTDVVLLMERVSAPGADKRELAGRVLGQLYDVLAVYDIPYIPNFLESRLEASLKPHFVEAGLALVDRLVARFNRTNAWVALSA